LKPYTPEDDFFTLPLPQDLLQLDLIQPEYRIQSLHYPLLQRFRKMMLERAIKLRVKEGSVAEGEEDEFSLNED
jgi:hypothetical protein